MPKPREQRVEVVAPRDRHGDVADRVLEDQVPADNPRDQLPQRRVGVRVGAAGLRNHRGELGVAEPRERARATQQNERQHQCRPGAVADHLAVRTDLPGGRGPDRAEDAGADDGADGEHDQVARAQHALERSIAFTSRSAIGLRRNSCVMCEGILPGI